MTRAERTVVRSLLGTGQPLNVYLIVWGSTLRQFEREMGMWSG